MYRPEEVQTAVTLLYFLLVVGALSLMIWAAMFGQKEPVAVPLVRGFVHLGFYWFLIHMVSTGRNWARIVLLVGCFAAGVYVFIALAMFLGVAKDLFKNLGVGRIWLLIDIGRACIQIYAVFLLFQKPSSDWFKRMKAMSKDKEKVIREPNVS